MPTQEAQEFIDAADGGRRESLARERQAARDLLEPDERRDLIRQRNFWRDAYGAAMTSLVDALCGEEGRAAVRFADDVLRIRWGDWYNCPRCGEAVGKGTEASL